MDLYESEEPMIPPPIVTYNEDANNNAIEETLRKILRYDFTLKRQKDAIYLYTRSKEDYDTLSNLLQFHEHGYYTYQTPWHNTQLIVLKNYLGFDELDIITDLKKKRVICLSAHVINRRPDDTISPAILVTLAGHTNLVRVKKIRRLGNIGGLEWVDYVADRYMPLQCHKCQRFKHESRFCHMPPNCVNCGEEHLSADCNNKSTWKCFNCEGEHPANDADCIKWITYKEGVAIARERASRKQSRITSTVYSIPATKQRIVSPITLANHMDSFWNLAQELGIESMCFDYDAISITFDYGPIPTNGAPFPVRVQKRTGCEIN